jgi:hypothetical protein
VRSRKQAIAIGLSKARRSGVKVPARKGKGGSARRSTRGSGTRRAPSRSSARRTRSRSR